METIDYNGPTFPTYSKIPTEDFNAVILRLARANIGHTLTLPGVWEAISEEYNNDALDLLCPDPE